MSNLQHEHKPEWLFRPTKGKKDSMPTNSEVFKLLKLDKWANFRMSDQYQANLVLVLSFERKVAFRLRRYEQISRQILITKEIQ